MARGSNLPIVLAIGGAAAAGGYWYWHEYVELVPSSTAANAPKVTRNALSQRLQTPALPGTGTGTGAGTGGRTLPGPGGRPNVPGPGGSGRPTIQQPPPSRPGGVTQPRQFEFVRASDGSIYRLNADGSVGAYVSDPNVIGNKRILYGHEAAVDAAIRSRGGATPSPATAPRQFDFVRLPDGSVHRINADGTVGALVTSAAEITGQILEGVQGTWGYVPPASGRTVVEDNAGDLGGGRAQMFRRYSDGTVEWYGDFWYIDTGTQTPPGSPTPEPTPQPAPTVHQTSEYARDNGNGTATTIRVYSDGHEEEGETWTIPGSSEPQRVAPYEVTNWDNSDGTYTIRYSDGVDTWDETFYF